MTKTSIASQQRDWSTSPFPKFKRMLPKILSVQILDCAPCHIAHCIVPRYSYQSVIFS